MKLIFTRSPYFISVNEAGQTGAKIKLYIWNEGTAVPTTPTYILSKNIPSATQTNLSFNISNYVREFIDNIAPLVPEPIAVEENKAWCFVAVERYKTVSTTDTLLDSTIYTCTNGYTKYLDGYNENIDDTIIPLTNDLQTIYYNRDAGNIPYVNLLFSNPTGAESLDIRWIQLNSNTVIDSTGIGDVGNFNYAIALANEGVAYDNGNRLRIIDDTTAGILATYRVIPLCEPKYTSVFCSFINAKGGWQFLTFFKAQTNNINVKGSTYKMMPSALNYNIAQGQTKSFNINGGQTVKLNTGWVDENYSDIITQLLLSETILLDNKPVEIKTQSSSLKTSLQDKMINYEMEFEYAFNLINDVI
jgi:hypothetical protein